VRVYTEFEDVGYSPCGIPYVHGREIPAFENLILQDREFYARQRIDVHYTTRVMKLDLRQGAVEVEGEGRVGFDRLVVATGFDYEPPQVPGDTLAGLYYVKNIRRAMEFDELIDEARRVVVIDASPLGLEMATAMAHRHKETHLIDPHPWLLSEVADPEIMKPVEDSLVEMGVQLHLTTRLEGFLGDAKVRAVATSEGEIPADLVVVCTPKQPNNRLAREAGLQIGSTGGIVVDERMATSVEGVYAAGDQGTGAGVDGEPCLRPRQGGRHQRSRGAAHLPTGLRALGDGRWQVDGRRRLLRGDLGHGAWGSLRHGAGRGHLPGQVLPRHYQDPGQAASRAEEPASDRGPTGGRGGNQGTL
jgi:NADPH-dependent 2,4-dienoyl-CoA reductase/sulfur reductase-like enzyme